MSAYGILYLYFVSINQIRIIIERACHRATKRSYTGNINLTTDGGKKMMPTLKTKSSNNSKPTILIRHWGHQ